MPTKRQPAKGASAPAAPSPRRQLATLMKKANADAGHPVMMFADQVPNPYDLRRPSGVMALDLDMAGGAPAGGMIKLTGPENTGKTALMYMFMAMHQRIYGDRSIIGVGYTEWKPDFWFMRFCGMKVAIPDEMIAARNKARIKAGLPPFTKEERAGLKEQVGDVVLIHGNNGENLLTNVVNAIKANVFGIIGLDSMTMIMPSAEAAKDMDEDVSNVRARAQLLTEFQTRVHYALTRMGEDNRTTLILIDQVRANPDKAQAKGPMAKFVKAYKYSDIYAARHGSMMTIMLMEGEKTRSAKSADKGMVLGKQLKWSFEKGSKGTHNNITGEVYYDYAAGVDLQQNIIVVGFQNGIIHEKGDALFVRNAAGAPVLDDIKGGPAELAAMMRADFQLEMDIRQFILQAGRVQCTYD